MLQRQLGRRVELDPLRLAERALGEGREPADRLDLVAEQLEPRRAVLGRPEDVEDVAADRELAAVLDLLDPLVARLDQQLGDVAEVDLLALVQDEPGRAQRGVGDGLGERHRRGDDDRRLVVRSPARRSARPAPRSAGRPGAAAAPGATRSRSRATGSSGPGAAPGRRRAPGRGRGRRRRRRRRPAPGDRRAPARSRAARRADRGGSSRKRAGRPPRRRESGPRGSRVARRRALCPAVT